MSGRNYHSHVHIVMQFRNLIFVLRRNDKEMCPPWFSLFMRKVYKFVSQSVHSVGYSTQMGLVVQNLKKKNCRVTRCTLTLYLSK